MTNTPIEESLSFDVSGALQGIGTIDDALQQVVQSFSVGLSEAISTLTGAGADLTPLADSLDVAGLGPAVDTALGGVDATIPVDVTADTTDAEAQIAGLDADPIVVPVEADPAPLEDLDTAAVGASGSVGDLTAATGGFTAAASLGRGEVEGLTAGVGLLGGAFPVVGAAAAAGGLTLGFFFDRAVDAQAAVQRLNQTFGPLANQIENLKVGDLTANLSELALSLGSDDDNLRNVASTLFLFQTGAGTSDQVAAKFSETVLALSARAVALNPALGRVEDVAGRLGNTLARGGRFASAFGISLSTAEIKARAAENAQRGLGDGVSFASLQIAGGQVALEKYGKSLEEDIAKGTANPIIQLRALRQKFEEAAEAIGKPLISPIFQILTEIEPIAENVGQVLGGLGQAILPLFVALGPALGPIATGLGLVGDGLGLIGETVGLIPGPILTAAGAFTLLGLAAAGAADSLIAFALTPAGAAIIAIGGALAILGIAARTVADDEDTASAATLQLESALAGAGSEATGLGTSIASAIGPLDDFLKKQLAIGEAGTTGADAVGQLGLTYKDLTSILTGSDALFQDAIDSLGLLDDQGNATSEANGRLVDTLFEARGALEANASVTLSAAVASGLLTEAQLKQAESHNHLKGEVDENGNAIVDYTATLGALQPAIAAATRAQDAAGQVNAASAGTYTELARALQAGTLTTDEATARFVALGFSEGGAADATKQLQSAVSSFVSEVESGLPQVGDAFTQIVTAQKDAFTKLAQDAKDGTGSIKADFKALVEASDPAQLAANLQKQASDINAFVLTLRVLQSQGASDLATLFAQQGVGALTQATQAAGDAGVRAADEQALRLRDAAVANADSLGVDLAAAGQAAGAQGGTAVVQGAADAITNNQAIAAAATDKGRTTGAAFQPDFTTPATDKLSAAAQAIGSLTNVPNVAGLLGVAAGEAFGQGLANGIGQRTPAIESAATAAAVAAEVAANKALGIKSPSTVGIEIGTQFAAGLALGVGQGGALVNSAGTQVADQLVAQLNAALSAAGGGGAASAAASQAFSSFLSGAVSALPSITSDISTFSQNIISTLAAQESAFKDYRKALSGQREDAASVAAFTRNTGIAYGVLAQATLRYNNIAAHTPKDATDAQKKALADSKAALSDAQQAYDAFARKLESANTQLGASAKRLQDTENVLKNATEAQDRADSPNAFINNLNRQTAAARRFSADLAKLVKLGDTDLAKQLADAGPEAAGALAKKLASSPAKARQAEAAIDAANSFGDAYQTQLTKLFGGPVAAAASQAGVSTGQALTQGLKISLQSGIADAFTQIPKALTPVAANGPTVIQTPSLAGGGPQSLALDLTINLPDGSVATAQTTVPFTPVRTRSLKQLVRAEVHAS